MHALPSAFFHQTSSASRMRVPRGWMAKSTMVVVPPKAAARVWRAGPGGLEGKSDDGAGAAEGRGAGAGEEIVGAGGAAKWHVEVGMAIDAAGQNVHRSEEHTSEL